MKKGLLFVAVISAFSFASCKKDHVCTCISAPGGTTSVTTYTASKKGDAQAACLSTSQVDASSNTTWTNTCTLK